MIDFEGTNEEQGKMIKAVKDLVEDLLGEYDIDQLIAEMSKGKGIPMDMLMEVMPKVTGGEMSQYLNMFISEEKSAFPIKLNNVRLLASMLVDYSDKFGGIAKFLTPEFGIMRYALTAMGFAAIASGPDGMNMVMNKYLPEMLNGNFIAYGITEPDAGTNTHKISTTAVREGDHYKLNGSKVFISAAKESKYMTVVAKIVSDGEYEGIGNFVIDSGSKGVSMAPMDIAVLGENQYNVYFDDVIVPKENLIGKREKSKRTEISGSVFASLNLERIMVAMGFIAIGRIAFNRTVEYARQKKVSGSPIGSHQSIKHSLSKIKIKLELANIATKRATEAYDAREDPVVVGAYANMAKLVGTEAADEACKVATLVYGANGLNKENDISVLYQLTRLFRVAPINNEMVLNYLGEHLLGLPQSYR